MNRINCFRGKAIPQYTHNLRDPIAALRNIAAFCETFLPWGRPHVRNRKRCTGGQSSAGGSHPQVGLVLRVRKLAPRSSEAGAFSPPRDTVLRSYTLPGCRALFKNYKIRPLVETTLRFQRGNLQGNPRRPTKERKVNQTAKPGRRPTSHAKKIKNYRKGAFSTKEDSYLSRTTQNHFSA